MAHRISFSNPPYLARMLSPFTNPTWIDGNRWRAAVRAQPVFPICRDNLIQRLLAMEWIITPRGGKKQEKSVEQEIQYYTRLLDEANDGEGFLVFLDRMFQDTLDIPFGGICEVVYWKREKNLDGSPKPYGIYNIDGATCHPTFNNEYPVMQIIPGETHPVYLAKGSFVRAMYNPRPEMYRQGYGMAPPEKVYLCLELLVRGDKYYANLLTDTPEAGILDLMDMDEDTANNWLESFRALLTGIDPFKIPVLYEHEQPARFIPFSRPPTEMLFHDTTQKYMGIAAAGYGLQLMDLGIFMGGGRSLAQGIRSDRQKRRTGIGTVINKAEAVFNKILPRYLKFEFQVEDEEEIVAKGRARATNIMAFASAKQAGFLTDTEIRQQLKADNLMSIDMPDDLPTTAAPLPDYSQQYNQLGGGQPPTNSAQETVAPDALGIDPTRDNSVPASQGGMAGVGTVLRSLIVNSHGDEVLVPTVADLSSPHYVDSIEEAVEREADIERVLIGHV